MAGANQKKLFEEILDGLNAAQRIAVEQIEGPVLVVAGPGTGKTHILAARIGRILNETDANPANILCLTFTDAGVIAMRNRLLKFIGPTAHRLHIYTFHSFCNRIIQDNLSLFGRHYLESLDDLERIEIVREILDHLAPDHPMRRLSSDGYFYERHLQDLFQRMKSEGWKESYMLQQIEAYITALPKRPEFLYKISRGDMVKGELKKAKYEEALLRMERLKSAIPLYEHYQESLSRKGRYDFDDMILWVLNAFNSYPSLLRAYQEQYLYILVDEYQDTNGAQNQILQSLIQFWENPNIFIVGDDDQSIYEFQGARLKNLTDFYESYAGFLKTIVLQENYRSTPAILKLAENLILHNEKRLIRELADLGLEKRLEAAGDLSKSEVIPEIQIYDTRLQEVIGVVDQILAATEAGIPTEEIAVIYARHRQAELLIELLQRKEIPFQIRRKPNALDAPIVQRIRMILEYLSAEQSRPGSGEEQLYRILHFKHWNIAPGDLAKLSIQRSKMAGPSRENLRTWLGTSNNIAPVQAALNVLDKCLLELGESSFPRFMEFLLNESGMVATIFEDPERDELLGDIQAFIDFVRQQALRNPRLEISELLDLLKRMDSNRLILPQSSILPAAKGVQLLTAHGSKGLEFQQVYLIDCVKDSWEPRRSGGQYRFVFPDTLTFSGEEDALEARRRLFYVALTRAKEKLVISHAAENEKGKALQPPVFVEEIRELEEITTARITLEIDQIRTGQNLLLKPSIRVKSPVYQKAQIDELLEDFSLSVSGMNAYLRCPLSFFYEHILRVPRLPSEAASFGTAMHNSLQWLFERMLLNQNRDFPPVEAFIGFFDSEMKRLRPYFKKSHYQQRRKVGEKHLKHHYFKGLSEWSRKVRVEADIRQVEWQGIPIKGVIDKIEYLAGSEVRLVDYKTGRPDSAKARTPTERKPEGGPYWRQLLFYKILFEAKSGRGVVAKQGRIAFLESDDQGDYLQVDISIGAAEVEQLGILLKSVYQGIMSHDFRPCAKPECFWCRFEKDHVHPDLRLPVPEEKLDDNS